MNALSVDGNLNRRLKNLSSAEAWAYLLPVHSSFSSPLSSSSAAPVQLRLPSGRCILSSSSPSPLPSPVCEPPSPWPPAPSA